MGSRPLVLASMETSDGQRCVDIFRRPDGSHGFEEFRRDPEDPSGWHAAGNYGDRAFDTEADAKAAAISAVPWLQED